MQSSHPFADGHAAERDIAARRHLALALLLVITTVAILLWRKPDQFLIPAMWAEDAEILRQYAERGWASIVEPIQGYHILVTRLITMAAFWLSFLRAPYVAVSATVAFTCLVTLAVAFSPTHLRYRPLCALAVLLVPTDAEVFAVALYAFWWAGILLLLALLWDRGLPWLRAGYIVLGGLSSPLIGPVAILLAARAAVERTRLSVGAAALAVALAGVQSITAYFHIEIGGASSFDVALVKLAVARFVGSFYAGASWFSDSRAAYLGYGMLAVLAIMFWIRRDRLDRYFLLLVLMWAAVCAMSIVRVPLDKLHPLASGPRYFFYPFVLMIWAGLWIAAVSGPIAKATLAIAYLVALWSAVSFELPGHKYAGFIRRHDFTGWRAQVQRCALSEKHELPFHHDGNTHTLWRVALTGAQCRALLSASVFPAGVP